jgi:hypothetical protein
MKSHREWPKSKTAVQETTKMPLCSFCGSDHYLFVSKRCSGIYICAACASKYFTKFNADKAYRKREEMLQKVKS